MDLNRNSKETDAEFMLRVCALKDEIGTWEDVANIINKELGQSYTESTYRKRYKKECQHQLEDPVALDTEKAEKIKAQTLSLERNRFDRSLYRQQLYYEQIKDTIEALPLPTFRVPVDHDCADNDMQYILTLADVHYGANFKSENNQYSTMIAKERFEYLTGRTIDFIIKHNVSTLNVVSLGDMIQGILRVSDIRLNETSIVRSTVEVSRLIAMFLNELSGYAKIKYYHAPQANHTQIRPLGTKANELANEDIEYIIGNYIRDLCINNKNIKVVLAEENKSYIRIPIHNYNILAMHGHQVKNIDTVIKDYTSLTREFVDYVFIAHLHNNKCISAYEGLTHDAEVFVVPSFVGSDPYSDSILKGTKSSVKIYGIDFTYGCTEQYKIVLN